MGCSGSSAREADYAAATPTDVQPVEAKPTPSRQEPAMSTEDAEMPDDTEEVAELSGARLEKVKAIFAKWLTGSESETGMLELKSFSGASVTVGPHSVELLKTLSQMDTNGDGFVEASEWQKYFQPISAVLSDEEFAAVLEGLETSGQDLITILSCSKLAANVGTVAGSSAADKAGDAEGEDMVTEDFALSAEQEKKVGELFGALASAWGTDGAGTISVDKLQGHKMVNGPNQLKIFESLEAMDADGDKEVTLVEMMAYFTILGENMSETVFQTVYDELAQLAQDEALISSLTALATSGPMPSSGATDEDGEAEEDYEAPERLSSEELAKLEELFLLFVPNKQSPIQLSDLGKKCRVEVGPNTEDLLAKSLEVMDDNKDGMVTFDEMSLYFSYQRANGLSTEDFGVLVQEMMDSVNTASMLEMAK